MDHYPYLTVTRGHLFAHHTPYTLHDATKRLPTDKPLYLLDTDGIATNQPNYNTYQRLSSHTDLWIDAGPRTLNDLIDIVMAGATTIILRPNLWPTPDIDAIQDISDCNLYTYFEDDHTPVPPHINGLIIPYTGKNLPQRPLQHTQLPAYLLNLTDNDNYPDAASLTAVFQDFTFFTTENHP